MIVCPIVWRGRIVGEFAWPHWPAIGQRVECVGGLAGTIERAPGDRRALMMPAVSATALAALRRWPLFRANRYFAVMVAPRGDGMPSGTVVGQNSR